MSELRVVIEISQAPPEEVAAMRSRQLAGLKRFLKIVAANRVQMSGGGGSLRAKDRPRLPEEKSA